MKHAYAFTAALVAWLVFAPGWWRDLIDVDLWWLLWAGEHALEHGALPTVNGLWWTAPDEPWVTHEGGVALAYALVGVQGVWWLRGLVCSVFGLLALRMARAQGAWATILGLLWLTPLVSIWVSERALTWGLAFLAAEVALLHGGHRWRHGLAAAVVAVWSCFHGSFLLGVGLLGLFHPGWALAAAVGSMLNPQGGDLFALVVSYTVGHGATALVHEYVAEWHGLWPDSPLGIAQCVMVAAAGGLVLSGRDKRGWLLWTGLAVLTLKHGRHTAPLGVILLPYMVQRLDELLPKRAIGRPGPWLAAGLAATPLVAGQPVVDAEQFPPGVVQALRGSDAKTYADFRLSGWLAYEGTPAFWDSRNDCYPVEVFEDALRIAYEMDGWKGVLRRWDVERVVTRDPDLVGALRALGWRTTAEVTDVVVLLAPDD